MESKGSSAQEKFKVFIFEFILLFLIWLALTWTLDLLTVSAGLVAAFGVWYFFSDLFPKELLMFFNPRRVFWLLVYIPYFLYQVILSNFDVLYRVLHPDMPIRPGIVKVRTTLTSDLAKTSLANSITMTPGTMSVDIIGEYLYIHWINVKSEDIEGATEQIVGTFEKFLRRIFE